MKRYIKSSESDYSKMSYDDLYKTAKKQHLISTNSDKWTYDMDLLQYAIMYNIKLNKLRMREGKRLLKPDELNSLFRGNVQTFKRLFAEFWPKDAKKNPRIYYDKDEGYVVDSTIGEYQDEMEGQIDYFDTLGQYDYTEEPWEI